MDLINFGHKLFSIQIEFHGPRSPFGNFSDLMLYSWNFKSFREDERKKKRKKNLFTSCTTLSFWLSMKAQWSLSKMKMVMAAAGSRLIVLFMCGKLFADWSFILYYANSTQFAVSKIDYTQNRRGLPLAFRHGGDKNHTHLLSKSTMAKVGRCPASHAWNGRQQRCWQCDEISIVIFSCLYFFLYFSFLFLNFIL